MHGMESTIGPLGIERRRASYPSFFPVKQPVSHDAVDPDDPAWTAVEASLRSAIERFNRWEPLACQGEAEGIHHLRTASRRLRSELRTLTIFMNSEWGQAIEVELKWITKLLGGVRDLDVLTDRLRNRVAEAEMDDQEREALAPIFESLACRRERYLKALTEAMAGERYLTVRLTLERALVDRPWNERDCPSCREALGPLAGAAWSKLKKHARRLRHSDLDEAFHDVRKLAKRARYTAELVAPLIGRGRSRSAVGFIRETTRVQGKLGDHHDCSIAIAEIESRIRQHSDDLAFVGAARTLIEAETAASRRSRKAFFQEWEKLDRKKWRSWMKTSAREKS